MTKERFFMKKIRAFIGLTICLTALTSFSFAAVTPIESIPSDQLSDMSSDEEVFASLLNDENRATFAKMSSSDREECMHMTELYNITGKTLSPDAAVEKVASL